MADGGEDHVGDESGVDGFLCASLSGFDEESCAELDSVDGAEGALVAVGAGVGDAVVPVLALYWLANVLGDHSVEDGADFGEVNFELGSCSFFP